MTCSRQDFAGKLLVRLIQIVPTLPPAVGGVGDYALVLARGLRDRGWQTTFIAAREEGDRRLEAHDVLGLPAGDRASALVETLERAGADTVLLHYSGYGYAERGAPLWLPNGLTRWKSRGSERRLVVMFHEVHTTGRVPWNSSFWLSPIRKRVAHQLAQLADNCVTNCSHYRGMLRRRRPDADGIRIVPVPSNVGEADEIRPFSGREPTAVVFGQAKRRSDVYRRLADFMPVLERYGIEALEDVGPPLGSAATEALPIRIRHHGVLEPAALSDLLSGAKFGLLNLPAHLLAKSGCFAAYAAHGTVCLLNSDGAPAADGLRDGHHFVRIPPSSSGLSDERALETIGANVFAWYSAHRLERIAERYVEDIL